MAVVPENWRKSGWSFTRYAPGFSFSGAVTVVLAMLLVLMLPLSVLVTAEAAGVVVAAEPYLFALFFLRSSSAGAAIMMVYQSR